MAFSWLQRILAKARPHTAERQASDPEDLQAEHLQRNALGFFDLPRELRDQIYSYIFNDDKPDHPTHYVIKGSAFVLITERAGEACGPWDVYNTAFQHPFMPGEWTWASKRLMKEVATEFARGRIFKVHAPYPPSLGMSKKYYYRESFLLHCISMLVSVCQSVKTTPALNNHTRAGTEMALHKPSDRALNSFMALRHPDSSPLRLHVESNLPVNMHKPGNTITFESTALASMIGKLSRVEITVQLNDKRGPSGSVDQGTRSLQARNDIYKQLELRASQLMGSNVAVVSTCGNERVLIIGSIVNFRRILTIERTNG